MNRSLILDICESYENYKEGPNDNETVFGKWFGMDYAPWCAMAVSKILYEANNPLPNIQPPGKGHGPEAIGAAYVPYIFDYYTKKGKGIVTIAGVQSADITIFDWNKDRIGDHIGFFIKWNEPSKSFFTWEGNTSPTSDSNGGAFMKRIRYVSQVLAFINPDKDL